MKYGKSKTWECREQLLKKNIIVKEIGKRFTNTVHYMPFQAGINRNYRELED